MYKLEIILLILLLAMSIGNTSAHSGDTVDVRYGTTPVIDGVVSQGEWSDAIEVGLLNWAGEDTGAVAYLKHDTLNLYVAFLRYPGTYDWDVFGVVVDFFNDGGTAPKQDDLGFVYSGSEGRHEYKGNGNYWEEITISGWSVESSDNNQVEFSIGYAKLNISQGTPKLMGLHLCHGGAAPYEYVWPRHGSNDNFLLPDIWGDVYSSDNWGSGIGESEPYFTSQNSLVCYSVFPSPTNSIFNIIYKLSVADCVFLRIYDVTGKVVRGLVNEVKRPGIHIIAWNGKDDTDKPVPSGLYFCRLITVNKNVTKQMLLLK